MPTNLSCVIIELPLERIAVAALCGCHRAVDGANRYSDNCYGTLPTRSLCGRRADAGSRRTRPAAGNVRRVPVPVATGCAQPARHRFGQSADDCDEDRPVEVDRADGAAAPAATQAARSGARGHGFGAGAARAASLGTELNARAENT